MNLTMLCRFLCKAGLIPVTGKLFWAAVKLRLKVVQLVNICKILQEIQVLMFVSQTMSIAVL